MRYSVESGLAPKCRFRSIRTCCDTAAAMPWRTRATTHGRYRLGSATRTSNTPSGTPSWPQIGLRTSGDENLPLSVVERQRLKEISDENRFYCEKWGMKA